MTNEKWEYRIRLFTATSEDDGVREYMAKNYPDWHPGMYHPVMMEKMFNTFGEDGWEIIAIQPVAGVGENGDILTAVSHPGGVIQQFSFWYFVVMKRRKN